jgi:maleamate amidohydrolase
MKIEELGLLLVDIQRAFWQPLKHHRELSSFPANVEKLLNMVRSHRLAVVHTQAVFQPDRSDWMLFYRRFGRGRIPCVAGSNSELIEDFAAPVKGEVVVRKQTYDGFMSADLERVLRRRKIKALLIAGIQTSVCVLFTATSAYQRRFVPIVVRDACADRIEAHENTLRIYGGMCFQTVTTAEVVNDLRSIVRQAGKFAERT